MNSDLTAQEDSIDRYIQEHFYFINETYARTYYESLNGEILLASWKPETINRFYRESFRENAYHFAKMIAERKPKLILVDCRHFSIEISYLDQNWYMAQTRHLWLKLPIKKVAFMFGTNLGAQVAMEGLKEIAEDERIKIPKTRYFEDISEAIYWLSLEY